VDNTWLEVALLVDGELAEAVAEVFARFAPGGVAIESTAVTADAEDEGGQAVGPLRVCAYLPMLEGVEETRRRLEEALWYLGRIRPLPPPQFRTVQETDWAEAWKQHYHPIPLGRRLIIVPAWMETPPGARIPIRMDPGMAFGTGTHPTTQLCLEAIEAWFEARGLPSADGEILRCAQDDHLQDDATGCHSERLSGIIPSTGQEKRSTAQAGEESPTVIDVGCGSGILSIAALKLGASRALGVDIDPLAIPVAHENAVLNGVTGRLHLGVGSVSEILAGQFQMQQAPLVLANILAPIIIRLLEDGLARLVAPGGALVLSGVLQDQWEGVNGHPSLRHALARHDLYNFSLSQSGDWIAIRVDV
jgi:ribosomal protein L11 methyltransferase